MKKLKLNKMKPFIDVKNGSPWSNSNLFEVKKQQEAQISIMTNNIDKDLDIINNYQHNQKLTEAIKNDIRNDILKEDSQSNLGEFKSLLETKINEKFRNMEIDPYWLFLKYAEYKISILKFECNNAKFSSAVFDMLQTSYFIGYGGMYFKETKGEVKYTAISVNSIKVDMWNKVYELQIGTGNCSYQAFYKDAIKYQKVTNEKEIENILLMKWGQFGVGGWINDFKVAQTQGWLMKNLLVSVLIQNKKLSYGITNPLTMSDELDILFGDNPIIAEGDLEQGSFSNRVKLLEVENASNLSTLDFYNEYMKILFRDIVGRRFNDSEKGERNISNEVAAAQHLFNIIDDSIYQQFLMFEQNLKENELFKKLGIEFSVVKPIEIGKANQEKEYEKGIGDNNDNN